MTEPTPATSTRDLWAAVDALTQPRRRKLQRDDDTVEWFTLPSLWAQLVEAMDKNTGDQGNGKLQSRPPVNTAAMSLLLEIAGAVRTERRDRRLKAALDTPLELRAVISDVIRELDRPHPDNPQWTVWQWWEVTVRSWTARVRAAVGQSDTYRLHNAVCLTCGATTVPAFDTDGTETGRQPALIVWSPDGVVSSVDCDMCGSRLADIQLRDLWDRAREAKEKTA